MENEILKYKFWFILVFSVLLVVTFGLYIPLRFQHQSLIHEEAEMSMEKQVHEEHGASVQYHEEQEVREGLVTNLNITPAPFETGKSLRLDFFVNRKPGNIPVTNLEIDHNKLMHVIGVRNDMAEFFHIHPELTQEPGLFSINYTFQKPGLYKIWSEIKTEETNHAFGHPEFSVGGAGEQFEKNIDFGRNAITGFYQVALRLSEVVPAGKEIQLLFDVHTVNSSEVELEDYLAAPMHLTIIKDDWSQFIHTHPEGTIEHEHSRNIVPEVLANGGGHDTAQELHGISFKTAFPEPGLYKAFAQFRPKGIDLPPDEALLVEFWIRAEEKTGVQISPWWINLIWASLAIVILSWAVARYLKVK